MTKELLKNLIALKLKIVDEILDSIPVVSDSVVKRYYKDFVGVVNEATGEYIKEAKPYKKNKDEKKLKTIDIE
ncbi:hypothetical protein R9X47_09940 [Wukongibacter baidiensis]|uniref:hypothetical protein n=1 Tax=Wukongibacter baidiensis TaxID=1723361 RepID=UPI003D7FF14E